METFGILYIICGVLYIIGCCFEDKELRKTVAERLYKADPVVKEVEKLRPVYIDVGAKLQKVQCRMAVNELDYHYFGNVAVARTIDKCDRTLLEKLKPYILVVKSKDYMRREILVECDIKVANPNEDDEMRFKADMWNKGDVETHIGVPDFDQERINEEMSNGMDRGIYGL